MTGMCAFAAAMAIVGAVIGALAVISPGIHRQEAASLAGDTPGRAVSGARRLNSLHARGPGVTRQAGHI